MCLQNYEATSERSVKITYQNSLKELELSEEAVAESTPLSKK